MNEIEKAIAYEIDDIVGEYQVEFDNGEIRKGDITIDKVADLIYQRMTCGNGEYLRIYSEYVEKKSWKFMGKEQLKSIILNDCKSDIKENGKWSFLGD